MGKQPHINTPPCIAYAPNGRLCGRPGLYLDKQAGGYVCWAHRPLLADERPQGRADPPGRLRDGPPCGDVEAATDFPARPHRTRRGATPGQEALF